MKINPLLITALLLVLALGFFHALGMREEVSILSGTAPPGAHASPLLGVVYALSWFAALIVAPILALAALIDLGLARFSPRSGSGPAGDRSPPPPR